jgi:hypothetical protein
MAGDGFAEDEKGEDDHDDRLEITDGGDARGGHVAKRPIKDQVGGDGAAGGHVDGGGPADPADGGPIEMIGLADAEGEDQERGRDGGEGGHGQGVIFGGEALAIDDVEGEADGAEERNHVALKERRAGDAAGIGLEEENAEKADEHADDFSESEMLELQEANEKKNKDRAGRDDDGGMAGRSVVEADGEEALVEDDIEKAEIDIRPNIFRAGARSIGRSEVKDEGDGGSDDETNAAESDGVEMAESDFSEDVVEGPEKKHEGEGEGEEQRAGMAGFGRSRILHELLDDLAADGERVDAITARRIPEAGRRGSDDCAARSDFDFGRDDVLGPVALAGGNVTGKREIGKRGQGDVVSAADAGFEHAAAPDGDGFFLAEIVNAARGGVAADAAELDIDDLAGADFDGGASVLEIVNAFVEADGSLKVALKFGVGVDVVVAERLLDHDEEEIVELLEERRVGECVGGIGVGHEPNARKFFAESTDKGDVLAGLDFDLDALIAGGKFAFDFSEQIRDRRLQADRDAAGNFRARAAEKFPERKGFLLRFDIPESGFESGFGHVMAANRREEIEDFGGGSEFPALEDGKKIVAENVPGGFDGFVGIVRVFPSGGFGPADGAVVGFGFEEEDAAKRSGAETGLEGSEKLQMDFAEGDFFKTHERAGIFWGR